MAGRVTQAAYDVAGVSVKGVRLQSRPSSDQRASNTCCCDEESHTGHTNVDVRGLMAQSYDGSRNITDNSLGVPFRLECNSR